MDYLDRYVALPMEQNDIMSVLFYAIVDSNHIDHQNSQSDQPEKNLYVYDKAVTDFLWWAKQKAHQNYLISVLK